MNLAALQLCPEAPTRVIDADDWGRAIGAWRKSQTIDGKSTPFVGSYGINGYLYRLDAGASAWVTEPQARQVGRSLRSGRFPLWNPHEGFGAPLLANAQSGGFDLFRLPDPSLTLPENFIFNLGTDTHFLRRLVSTYLSPLGASYALVAGLKRS